MATVYKIIDNDPNRCIEYLIKSGLHAKNMDVFIGLEKDGYMIACSAFDSYNGASIFHHICISKGFYIPRKFWWFMSYYCFIQLGVECMIGITPSTNKDAIKLSKHYGYIEQYRLKNACIGGDLVIQTIKKDECKWLKIKVQNL